MNRKFRSLLHSLVAVASAVLCAAPGLAADPPREHLSLDANREFHLGARWRAEDAPGATPTVAVDGWNVVNKAN